MDSRQIQNNFTGKGWSFPPSFNTITGALFMTEKIDDINASLHVLLTTALGERVMQPKYGCNMDDLVFEALDTTTTTLIIDRIQTAITFFEPRIEAKKILLNTQNELEGEVLIEIEYVIKATNSRFNFVFPFFRNEGTEINFLTNQSV